MDDGELRFATPSDLGNLGRLPLSPPTVFEAGGAAPQTQRRRRFDPKATFEIGPVNER